MATAAGNNDGQTTVFLSTSLDTRLVTTLSNSDTVSDFKKKIMLVHLQCFPAIGSIEVHSLKVKRRGVFYHLPDSMLVKSAFGTTKGSWFVSVDASRLELDIQHFDKHKAGDALALPWVTHNGSISGHDNNGLLPIHSETLPLRNQIVSNADGDSCKDVTKHLEEDTSSADKRLVINKEISSKKRTHDVSNENVIKDPAESGLPMKKKRKTQRVKNNVKASEENTVLTDDNDQVKDVGVNINGENFFEHKSKDKDLIGENTIINNDDVVGRETIADVATVAEQNIQHGMYENKKENEPVQKAVMENEMPSSTRTSGCEHDAAGLTVVAPLKRGSKRSAKHKAAGKEVSSTSLINELNNIKADVIDSSQRDVRSNGQDSQGDLIHKHKEDTEFSLKQGSEVKLPARRKKVKKSAAKNKNESLVMHADDDLVGHNSSTVLAPILDEEIVGEKNEVKETTLIDDLKKNDELIVKEMEVSEPTKSCRSQERVENMEESLKNKSKDIAGSRKKKKDIEKTASKNDGAVVKQSDDVITSMDALHVDCVKHDEILKNLSEAKVDNIDDKLEKQNEKMDGVKKSARKKKTKKSATRKEDESIIKHVNGEIYDDVKVGDSSLPADGDREGDEGSAGNTKKNDNSSLTGPKDRLGMLQSSEVELESKKSQSIDHSPHLEDTSKNVTVSEVSKVNNEVDTTNDGSHEINKMEHFSPDQPNGSNKIASIDNRKATKKPKKKTKTEGLVGKAKKNIRSSLMGTQDQPSKLQSTAVELESKKSQSIDHSHHLEDTTVPEINMTNAGSSEINFMDHFAPGHQPNKVASIDNGKDTKKPKKKRKDDSRNDGATRSQIISKENNKVVTDPNIPYTDQIKIPRATRHIDAESSSSSKSFGGSFHLQKSKKQQSTAGPVKKVVPVVNGLLNAPGNIFGGDDSDKSSADDNSNSSTRTPSRKLASSSEESDSSIDSRRNRSFAIKRRDGGKFSRSSENKLSDISMADLLKSSSRYKKAKFTASQVDDTEPDFVPESQPLD